MEEFLKAVGVVLITLILSSLLASRDKTFSSILTILVCTTVLIFGLLFLAPVLDFLRWLEELALFQGDMMKILLKVTGISLLSEITALLCTDSGNASLAESLRIFSSILILWISLPIFQALLDLIRGMLEGI